MDTKIHTYIAYLLTGLVFITPLLFSTSSVVSFSMAKVIPLFLTVFVSIVLVIITFFNKGKAVLPVGGVFYSVIAVMVAYVLTSFFSIDPRGSFIGGGADIGTASFMGGLFLLMVIVSMFMRSRQNIFNACAAFVGAFSILAVFHLLRFFFGPDFLSFGIFNSVISNTVGRFADLGIVSGIAALISLVSIELLHPSRLIKMVSYVVLTLSLAMLAVTNFPIFVWGNSLSSSLSLFAIIGFFALSFFVYFISLTYRSETKRRVPITSLIVLVVSALFTFGAAPLQEVTATLFKVEPSIENRMLWNMTSQLSVATFKDAPKATLVGYGPQQFNYHWLRQKPVEANQGNGWNSNFDFGSGFLPSIPVTMGLIGTLAWMSFIGFFVYTGIRWILSKPKDHFSNYVTVTTFVVSLYLWIVSTLYTPSIGVFILTFFFSGLFLALMVRERILVEKEFVFDNSKSKSFRWITGLMLVLLFVIFWAFSLGERAVASGYAGYASEMFGNAQSDADIETVKGYLRTAASLSGRDDYARILANITLAQINSVLADNQNSKEQLVARLENLYPEALRYAEAAVQFNPYSFENQTTKGNILVVGASLGAPGYYDEALKTYGRASELNPNSPIVPYLEAKLEASRQNKDEAKKKLGEALQLKSDYVEAIVLLGSILAAEGNKQDALAAFKIASSLAPTNAEIGSLVSSLQSSPFENITNQAPVATSTATSTKRN